ncbi:MAG: hypothetical protein LH660_18390, partial [Phormidesmis sp. CAN_BIN36]|nr:hypothetical protein [Phormidesmis sp. CAN_BIN36]
VLVSQPTLKEKLIHWAGKTYPIADVWIEKTMRVEYQLGLFRHRVPSGYQLKVRFESRPQNVKSRVTIWENGRLVCNRSIQFSASLSDWEHHATTYFTDISEPLPKMLECIVKQYD